MPVDKLDGRVDAALFEEISNQSREQRKLRLCEIRRRQNADKSCKSEGTAPPGPHLAPKTAKDLVATGKPRDARPLSQERPAALTTNSSPSRT